MQLVHGSPLDEDDYIIVVRDAYEPLSTTPMPLTFFGHTHIQGGFAVDGERWETVLTDRDLISVPPGVYRDFKNVGDELGRLLVMIQPEPGDSQDAVYHAEQVGLEIEQRWGKDTREAMSNIGIRFGQP